MLRQWASVTNRQSGVITLHEVAAASPLLATPAPYLTHFGGGDWAAEWTTTTEALTPGTKIIESRGGVQPHLRCCPFFLLGPDGLPEESDRTVLAGALAWGGNIRFAFERTTTPALRVWSGHNPASSEYVLEPDATFITPEQIWMWSTEGTGPLTRRFHRWVRAHGVRDGDELRPIVVNNWEATSFSFDTDRLLGLVDHTADVGAELFLLDDGWFGKSHPRDDDSTGLGDWEVDETKLPGGLGARHSRANDHGIRFGLWVEPEMVNPASTLYDEHPDWVVGQPARRPRRWRHQHVLDVLQPAVSRIRLRCGRPCPGGEPRHQLPQVGRQRPLTDPGSATLAPIGRPTTGSTTPEQRGDSWSPSPSGIRSRRSCCAARVAGGSTSGRCAGSTRSGSQTTPILSSGCGCSGPRRYFLPANVVAADVTREGDRPVAFGCAVAMSARFGFDIDFAGMTEDELAVCRRAAALYRDIRPSSNGATCGG